VDADGLQGRVVLLEVMARPGVHERRWSTVSSRRKPTAGESTCPEVSLTDSSGCRWSLHGGGWVKSFGAAQRRKREVRQWCLPVNRGGGKEWSRELGGVKGVEAERENRWPGVLPL
jgi:hypothetical protein